MIAAPPKKLDLDNDGRCLRSEECCFEAVRQARPRSDGTLDRRELGSRLSATPTKTGFRTKMNFSRLPRNASKAADPDNDSTVDAKELKSAAHHPLVQILK
jgi:hypothetical protein